MQQNMAITMFDIDAVIGEIAPALAGGWVQKIGEPAAGVILFDIRVPGRTLRLLLSIGPSPPSIHIATRPHSNPAHPPPFCQLLRSRLLGTRLVQIAQLNADRLVRLDFATREEQLSLVAEWLGKQADLLLLDEKDQIVATYARADHRVGGLYRAPTRPSRGHPISPSPFCRSANGPSFPVSAELERRYSLAEDVLALQQLTHAREASLRKTIKKQYRLIAALSSDLAKATQYQPYARYGELLKGVLGRLHKGQAAVTLVDYFDEQLPELVIPLDPAKSPRGNMDDYFAKHRKFLTAQREILPRIESIRREVRQLEKELEDIRQGRWQPSRHTGPGKAHSRTESPTAQRSSERRGPFRRFTSVDGLPIYVGRNARENDELTFRVANSDDLWLHAQGAPGSHVIIRLEKGADTPVETLKDAAVLAVLYSDLKRAGKGDVIYTKRKWVRKPKGASPGSVLVTQERTLFVHLDKARLDALKLRSI
jgi:predicted ribosome quality control (RQC) complex YloA/Tae2 family protein